MPQPEYPQTADSIARSKRDAARERLESIPLIGWDVDDDGIVQHDVRKNANRERHTA